MFNLCRGCCKKRAFKETADCPGEALATVPLTLPRPLGQWDLGPAEPHFLPHPPCQVTGCFLKPNWRNRWPGRGPSPSCRSPRRQDPGTQAASRRPWAVPWPEGRTCLSGLRTVRSPPPRGDTFTQGTSCSSTPLSHTAPRAFPGWTCPDLAVCPQVNNKPSETCVQRALTTAHSPAGGPLLPPSTSAREATRDQAREGVLSLAQAGPWLPVCEGPREQGLAPLPPTHTAQPQKPMQKEQFGGGCL